MNNKRIIYTLFALTLLAGVVKADPPTDGTLYYNVDDGTMTAEVRKPYGYNHYTGDIVVPATITVDTKTYNVTSIKDSAFFDQDGKNTLTSLVISDNVTHIGKYALANCPNLASLTLPAHITEIDTSTIVACPKLTQLIIPEGVTTIKFCGIKQLDMLDSLVIPSSVTKCEKFVFGQCNLHTIGIDVSWDATQLAALDTADNFFQDYYFYCDNVTLYVPDNDEDSTAYANTLPWSCFNIVRKKPAPTPPTPPTLDTVILADTVMHMADTLATLVGLQKDIVKVGRKLLRNGDYNTMCLPFNVSADTIALPTCPLYNCTIYRLTGMTITTDTLELEVEATDSIKAGKPYLVKYNSSGELPIDTMLFRNVTFVTATGTDTIVPGATMHGVLTPTFITKDDKNVLFMAAGNTLKWNETGTALRSFRAWFTVENSSPGGIPVRRGMPARIVEQHKTPTAIETIYTQQKAYKAIENGQLIIVRDSMKFNAQGQRIQ